MGNALRLGISRIGLAWTKWRMKRKIKRKSISVLILGPQASGKTTIALRLWKYKRILPDLRYVQTKGFNTYTIKRKNRSTINLYDLGGHSSIQELWEHYYADAHGVIFVVDVSDRSLISEASDIFDKVLKDERIRGKPVLLLANKHDLNEGATEVELDSAMNLQELVNSVRCLTRLEESTATDLKNDKGIFEGFRWLVSYIEKHYLELDARVIRDTLVEQNNEKARRAAAKELIGKISNQASPVKSKCRSNTTVERPLSQKSLRSLKFVRTESSTELITDEKIFTNSHLSTEEGKENAEPKTNYLIKSRPSSSNEEKRNPFLTERNIATAPADGRESRESGRNGNRKRSGAKSRADSPQVHFVNPNRTTSAMSGDQGDTIILVKSTSSECVEHSAVGRLSPEGADSDEGIVNPVFDQLSEESHASVTKHSKIDQLVRVESSDTERPAEITMVTTLVQIHDDQISKDRRRSTSSYTHGSATISLSSLKSEETEEGSRDGTPPASGIIQSSSTLPSIDNDKGKRKYSLRPRNKTGPLPPGMSISTVQSSFQSPSHSRFPGPTPLARKGRETLSGSGNSKLKKKSLSGFSDSRETTQPGSQFVREVPPSQMERLKKY